MLLHVVKENKHIIIQENEFNDLIKKIKKIEDVQIEFTDDSFVRWLTDEKNSSGTSVA